MVYVEHSLFFCLMQKVKTMDKQVSEKIFINARVEKTGFSIRGEVSRIMLFFQY